MTSNLDQAIAATQQSDWTCVFRILQTLPTQKENRDLWDLTNKEWHKTQIIALETLLKGDFATKWEIIKFYPKLGDQGIAVLSEYLIAETTDFESRWFIIRLLGQFDRAESILILVKFLHQTKEEELISLTLEALAHIGLSAIESLGNLLDQAEYRFWAVKALAHIRHRQIIPYLVNVVDDPSPEIRVTAIEALGSFRDPEILEILRHKLIDPAAIVRKEVVIALTLATESCPQESTLDLLNLLKPLLYDVSLAVSQQTILALARIGTNDAAELLFPLLKSPATPIMLKLDVVRAFHWINTAQTLDYLEEGLRWSDEVICQEIVRVLGRLTVPALKAKSSHILIDFLLSSQKNSTSPSLKQAIAFALGELGQFTAFDCLSELAQDSQRSVQLHALAALKKLSPFPSAQCHS